MWHRFFLGTKCSWAHMQTVPLFEQHCCNGVSSSRNFGASSPASAGNGTGADDDNRMQVDSLKKGKGKGKLLVHASPPSETASTLSYPSQTPSTIEALWCNPDLHQKGWIMTLEESDNQFRVFHKETSCRVFASWWWRTASRLSNLASRTKDTIA